MTLVKVEVCEIVVVGSPESDPPVASRPPVEAPSVA